VLLLRELFSPLVRQWHSLSFGQNIFLLSREREALIGRDCSAVQEIL
jgi:hypothetical protein